MGMTTAGWLFLATAWTSITILVVFCFRRVLQTGSKLDED